MAPSKRFHLFHQLQVYGPCGNTGSKDAMEDLVDGKACNYSNRT
jgi:hypothetical protein